jgi:hypothetical protein
MNNEAVFALRFVMKDFTKMRKAIEQINKNLEQMKNNANKASGGMNKVNTAMGKTTRSLLKFAAAYFTISKITSTIFSKANEAIQLRLMADMAGVAADKVGKLGKALRLYGGDAKAAGAAYGSLTNIIGGATHGMGVSEDVSRVNAMYGIGFNYGNISQEELMTQIAIAMKRLKGNNDQWAINQIASAYGLDSSVASFLSKHGADWSKQADAQKIFMPAESETKQLIKKEEELKEGLSSLMFKFEPLLSAGIDILQKMLPVLETIANVLDMKWWKKQGEKIGETFHELDKLSQKPYVAPDTEAKIKYAEQQMLAGKLDYGKYINLLETYRTQDKIADFKRRGFTDEDIKTFGLGGNSPIKIEDNSSVKVSIINESGNKIKLGSVESDRSLVSQPISVKGG